MFDRVLNLPLPVFNPLSDFCSELDPEKSACFSAIWFNSKELLVLQNAKQFTQKSFLFIKMVLVN